MKYSLAKINLLKGLVIVSSIFLLTSCSLLSPVKTETSKTYVINKIPPPEIKRSKRKITLLVTQPEADAIFNTTGMAYSDKTYEVAYFAKSRWAETPPQMLQPLLTQTLQKTQYFSAVISSASMGRYDYILNTQLLELQQIFMPQMSIVVLKLRAQIINADNHQLLGTKEFTALETAPERNPYGGVIAANKAAARILQQVAVFCLQTHYN